MNKIYLGEIEVANVGSGGGGDYVLNSSFDEMTKVAASALLDLKGITDNIEEFNDKISDDVSTILSEVTTLDVNKADVSTVYTKTERDKTDKVSAAALASLNERVTDLDASALAFDASIRQIAQQGGGGGLFDPSDIDASISDISTRVHNIEADYVVSDDISTFVTRTALDASYNALDTSIKAFDDQTRIIAAEGKSNCKDNPYPRSRYCSELGVYPKTIFAPDSGDGALVLHVGCGNNDEERKDALQVYDNGDVLIVEKISGKMVSLNDAYRIHDASLTSHDASLAKLDASALAFDASIRQIAQQGGGGGGSLFDPTDINTSISNISTRVSEIEADYVVSDDISTFVTEEDVSGYVRGYTYDKSTIDSMVSGGGGGGGGGITPAQLDASLRAYTYEKQFLDASYGSLSASIDRLDASALSFDASIRQIAQQGGGGSSFDPSDINASIGDISTRVHNIEADYVVSDDISTFKPIEYTNLSTYEDKVSEGTIDQDTMYVITDLASSDELSTLVTIDDLSTYKQTILDDVSTTADQTIANASTQINSIKTQAISAVQSQQTTSVNAVSSQQTTSVNAVNTAKNTALDDISTAMAQMKQFEVMTEAEYALITPDANTIYFITD